MSSASSRYTLEALAAAACAALAGALAVLIGPVVLVVLILAGFAVAAFARSPRFALGTWLAIGFFVPYWLQVGLNLPPQALVAGGALLALLPKLQGVRWQTRGRAVRRIPCSHYDGLCVQRRDRASGATSSW